MTQTLNQSNLSLSILSLSNSQLPQSASIPVTWNALHGCAQSLAIVEAAQALNKPILVITDSSSDALQIHNELDFFRKQKSTLNETNAGTENELPLYHFPDWETLPYDHFSPHEDIISERLKTLYSIQNLDKGIILVSINSLMLKLCPKSFIEQQSLIISVGQTLDIKAFRQKNANNGYQAVSTVYEHGEFAIRGNIIDIFPMGSETPIRIELFDNEIESLRSFDPENQRSQEKIDHIELLPAREYPLNKAGTHYFMQKWHDTFIHNEPKKSGLYQDIKQNIPSPGAEYFLPLFFDTVDTLFDYILNDTHILFTTQTHAKGELFFSNVSARHDELGHDIERPILPPNEICTPVEALFEHINNYSRIKLNTTDDKSSQGITFNFKNLPELSAEHKHDEPLHKVAEFINEIASKHHNTGILLCADSMGRRELVLDLLKKSGIKPVLVDCWQDFLQQHQENTSLVAITIAPLERSLWLSELNDLSSKNILVIAESALFGSQVLQRRRREKQQKVSADLIIKNLAELNIGDAVVHQHNGIGRYHGLATLNAGQQEQEFLILEYADEAKLYIPVYSLHLISRYNTSAADEAIPLHKLGAETWSKQKQKAQKQIIDTAAELLETYAKREASKGLQFDLNLADYHKFCADFPFETTPDQAKAIEAVLGDMQSTKPMDRLVCGDVGFGKTEVAMRAAFVAITNNKQVVVLAPTTLLVKQHYENFVDRFADWPVNIAQLSRFNSTKEQNEAVAKLSSGNIDIIIGTHKLIQKDIRFKNLGLIIVDEEHRFGVRQKEQLKKIKADADILTMTATPIPRTLNMALGGLRDLSIIATAPNKRLAVKTFVSRKQDSLIKEAVYREILRGGQVYYLHNDVSTIELAAEKLNELIPEARVGIAHGQLRERELEEVMSNFYHRRFNVLACSTIIETGIDIPNANTIIIERADKFGIAQLHQLRGRVGRSHHQAYAYMLTPPPKTITKDAKKRLEAIEAANTLGAGFMLASHDLEIRGAGEILGDGQSGNIQHIGFSLYMELLNRAVDAMKNGEDLSAEDSLSGGLEVNLQIPALIPDDYIGDVHHRLVLYKRIASAKNHDALDELQVEMIDRFGLLPEEVKNLIKVTEVKLLAEPLKLERIDMHSSGGTIHFGSKPSINPLKIIQMVQNKPHIFKLQGSEKLKFSHSLDNAEDKIQFITGLVTELASE